MRRSAAFRRAVESLFAVFALVPCLPLMALTAIIVWINLGRPLFFTQVRAGVGMRAFTILKFRTMTEARGPDGELLADELRQTKLTALLRRLRLDELPQLLSILRGDMSLVGPRPLPVATVAAFGERGHLRCLVPPGLTGWAQVNGNTRLSDDQKIALDLWYVGHASLRLDGLILLMTLKTIVLGEKVHREHLRMAEDYLAGRANLPG
nr:sugar transferase [Ensifer sp. IC4062]